MSSSSVSSTSSGGSETTRAWLEPQETPKVKKKRTHNADWEQEASSSNDKRTKVDTNVTNSRKKRTYKSSSTLGRQKVSIDWENLARNVWGQVPFSATLQRADQEDLLQFAMQHTQHQDSLPPPHPQLLSTIRKAAVAEALTDDSLIGRLDHSALVAIGIYVEEMVTANLLPLATLHTQHCRERPQDWIQPHTRVFQHYPISAYLPTAAPPTRTLGPSHHIFNLPSPVARQQVARDTWRRSTRQDGVYVPDKVLDYLTPSAVDER